ncbi:hypothetical protein BJY52DRAFT_891164 [Lactarius psammicola]|nr:hypothetical protein BJY52DRAFT_891164 [Lactarius psammicola]
MSTNRGPPLFPYPFPSARNANLAQNSAGTPEQPPIGPAQGSVYPPERIFARNALGTSLDTPYWSSRLFPVHGTRSTPSHMPPPNEPPRHPSAHIPTYQPIQGSVHSHPTFPMPQVQDTRVSTTTLVPPPPIIQRIETTQRPGHLPSTQVATEPYSSYPLQAPIVSHSLSQRGSGMSKAAHTAPRVQRYLEDDSDDEGYEPDQGFPEMHDSNMRAKGPPSCVAYGVMSQMRATLS